MGRITSVAAAKISRSARRQPERAEAGGWAAESLAGAVAAKSMGFEVMRRGGERRWREWQGGEEHVFAGRLAALNGLVVFPRLDRTF